MLLQLENLSITLPTARGPATVVRGISLRLNAGGTLGIVGESGSGKSLTALAILGLLPTAARVDGRILFEGIDLTTLNDENLQRLRGRRIGMVFQEPMTALNPLQRIGDQVGETLMLHEGLDRKTAWAAAARLLDRVGIARAGTRLAHYPHEMSGGERQRVALAGALACKPALLIADEATSALDVTVQAQLIDLIRAIVAEEGMALLAISHDLGVVARLAAETAVFYGGAVMESGATSDLFRRPSHPYTQALLGALPQIGRGRGRKLNAIAGIVPGPLDMAPGCPFHGRCPRGDATCHDHKPLAVAVGATRVACFHPGPAR
jgi:peptide/nickel transport system ATP-binding protein